MTRTAQDAYLQSRITSAPPQQLHLMLLDGALRFGRQAAAALESGDHQAAAAPLLRVIDILGELVAGSRAARSELGDRLAKLYWFLFQSVTRAKINGDSALLAEALRLVEYERDTWRMVCDKADSPARPAAGAFSLEA
jgi:flagellar protein FliS